MNPQDPQNPEPPNDISPSASPQGNDPGVAVPPPNPTTAPAAPATPNLASNTVTAPSQPASLPPAKGSRKKKLISTVVSLVAFAVFIAVLIILPRYKTVPLEAYSNSKFSLLAPKDYQKTEDDSSVTFEEKGEDEGTKSSIEAYREDFPQKLDAAQQKSAMDSVESGFKASLDDLAKKDDNTVEDYKAESTTFKGNTARTITATVKHKGSTAGRVKVVVGVTETSLYMVAVEAHQSDRGVTNNIDKIINSFELK